MKNWPFSKIEAGSNDQNHPSLKILAFAEIAKKSLSQAKAVSIYRFIYLPTYL